MQWEHRARDVHRGGGRPPSGQQMALSDGRRSVVSTLDEALATIPDGAVVGIGGAVTADHPMALVRALARRRSMAYKLASNRREDHNPRHGTTYGKRQCIPTSSYSDFWTVGNPGRRQTGHLGQERTKPNQLLH